MTASERIECIVAPGCVVYSGPPNAAGIATNGSQPGETVRVTREEAAHLRATGHLMQADGSPAPQITTGPMPINVDAR